MRSQAKLLPDAGINLVCGTVYVTGSHKTMNAREKQK
jgi:hypothetical protein